MPDTDKGYKNMKEIEKVDIKLYKEEFAILNHLYERLDFCVFSKEVYCKSNFFETIAWYIELLKEKNGCSGWKETMQKLIDDILKYKDDAERFKFLYVHFAPLKIEFYKAIGRKSLPSPEIVNALYTRDDKGKIDGIFPGVPDRAIPQWYWTWFIDSGLDAEVIAQNRRNLVAAMRHGMDMTNKNDDD